MVRKTKTEIEAEKTAVMNGKVQDMMKLGFDERDAAKLVNADIQYSTVANMFAEGKFDVSGWGVCIDDMGMAVAKANGIRRSNAFYEGVKLAQEVGKTLTGFVTKMFESRGWEVGDLYSESVRYVFEKTPGVWSDAIAKVGIDLGSAYSADFTRTNWDTASFRLDFPGLSKRVYSTGYSGGNEYAKTLAQARALIMADEIFCFAAAKGYFNSVPVSFRRTVDVQGLETWTVAI